MNKLICIQSIYCDIANHRWKHYFNSQSMNTNDRCSECISNTQHDLVKVSSVHGTIADRSSLISMPLISQIRYLQSQKWEKDRQQKTAMSPLCNEDLSREKRRSQGGSSNRGALVEGWCRRVSVIPHNYGLRELRRAGVAFRDRDKGWKCKEGLRGEKMAVPCLIIIYFWNVKWVLER